MTYCALPPRARLGGAGAGAAVSVVGAAVGVAVLAGCAPWQPAAPALPAVPAASYSFVAAGLADADTLRATELAPGVTHHYIRDLRGPWAIHVIEVDRARCAPLLQARKPAGTLAGRATTSELAAGAIAAINADFFMLPGGTPIGAHVEEGVPFSGPSDWPLFAVLGGGRTDGGAAWHAGVAWLEGSVEASGDATRLVQINRGPAVLSSYAGTGEGVTLFTARVDSVPDDSAALRLLLRWLDGDESAGRAVVLASDSPAAALPLGAGRAALLAHGAARDWARRRAAGDTVAWRGRVVVDGGAVVMEAVGGFPALLRAGEDVLGTQNVRPPFGEERHPRTAIGWTAAGERLFLVVVDGRQPPYSDGMSLPEMVWLFRRIGAAHALNLDGGGSTALVIRGSLVSRPSDSEGERPVGNALALAGCHQ
jgi:hypothetical protein